MQEIGQLILVTTFLVTLATAVTAAIGAITKRQTWMRGARHGLFAVGLMCIAMAVILTHGFLTHAFESKYITQYSERAMPLVYKLAAFWGGERGALLFWVTSLAVFSNIAVQTKRNRSAEYLSWVTSLLAMAILFFLILMVFQTSPFDTWMAQEAPTDGQGLNPLLQNPVMAFHPPSLLTGYILFTIPFAFGMAALITKKLDDEWIADTRRWTIVSWAFLTVGLLLGCRWAYMEIGWGFWWMWDAVENAGLVPWFTATAFLHSVMIQERRGMLKRWNVVLLALTFLLTIVGTWMTRSQIIVSIHAFADSELSDYFLWYMAIIFVFSVVLISRRWKSLRSEAHIESFMSREAMFVLNNIIFVFCAAVVLYGTLMGKFTESETVRNLFGLEEPVVWDEEKFNQVFVPIGIALLAVLGVGPLISWRKATARNFRKNFMWPLAWGSLMTLVGAAIVLVSESAANARVHQIDFSAGYEIWAKGLDTGDWISILVYWMCAFVLFSVGREFHIAAKVRKAQGLGGYWGSTLVVLFKNPRRYGGYIVHAGVIFMFLAFTGKAFKHEEKDRHMAVGDTHLVDRYALSLVDRDHYYSNEEGCVVSDATFVVMPLRSTVSEGSVKRLEKWLGERKVSTFHVRTQYDEPFMEVRLKDAVERRALVADYFLARHFAKEYALDTAARGPLTEVWQFRDGKLVNEVPMHAMEKLRAARDSFAAAAIPGVTAELRAGTAELTLRFRDKPTQELFAARLGGARVPDWVLSLRDDEETGAVSVVDRMTGQTLVPESRYYKSKNTSTTEVAIGGEDFLVDLYVSMQPDMGRPYVKVFTVVFPLVNFLWIGGLCMLLGAVICLTPRWLARAVSSFVSSGKVPSEVPVTVEGFEPAHARIAVGEGEVVATQSVSTKVVRTGVMVLIAIIGAVVLAGAAHADSGKPEPTGFEPPQSEPGDDLLQTLDCGCPLPPGELRPVALGDATCSCEGATRDRRIALDLLSQQAPSDVASGRAKYLVLSQIIEVDRAFETRIRFEPEALTHLLKTTRTTCPGEYLMTLEATRATCSHRMRWVQTFRLLLAAGVSEDDIFAFYLADNNANQDGGPWEAHVLRTSDEQVVSYWLPAVAVLGVLLVIGLIVWRNRRRALAAGRMPSVEAGRFDAPPDARLSREARGEKASLSVGDRDRLRDELEAYDA